MRSGRSARLGSSGRLAQRHGLGQRQTELGGELLDGRGREPRPRPAGRSGCVSTSGTRRSRRDDRAQARNGEVGGSGERDARRRATTAAAARQITGTDLRVARVGGIVRGALGLLRGLLLQALALELRQIVDEQLAVEVVHLVLNADGEHPFGVELERLAVRIERAHANHGGAIDEVVELGHRKAAFLGVSLALGAR